MLNSIQDDLSNTSRNYFEELTQLRAYTMSLNRSAVSTNYIIGETKPNTIDYNNIPYLPRLQLRVNTLLATISGPSTAIALTAGPRAPLRLRPPFLDETTVDAPLNPRSIRRSPPQMEGVGYTGGDGVG